MKRLSANRTTDVFDTAAAGPLDSLVVDRRGAMVVCAGLIAGASLAPWRRMPRVEPHVPRFVIPLSIPPTLRPTRTDATTDYYEIEQRESVMDIVPQERTSVWGYAGRVPGPTLHARAGRGVVVRHTNRLPVPTVVHLHGGHTEPDSDGFPTDLVQPGESRTYKYGNGQSAATLWYHDHAMDHTGRNLYMGLAGFYLIHDDEESALRLPSGAYDVPLMIQNRSLDSAGALVYDTERFLGAGGDVLLVNGTPWPRFDVAARKYRFRVLNASNSTKYELALSNGRPLVQIATDGGLLPGPLASASIPLAMAERVEVVIDFSGYPIGTTVLLQNLAGDGPQGAIMRFDVVRAEADDSDVPSTLRPISPIAPPTAPPARTFVFDGGPSGFPPVAHWAINGNGFDPERVVASPKFGDIEVWRFINHKRFGFLGRLHPVHVHLVHFQILERNARPPLAHERGWKDTVALEKGDDVRIAMRFDGFRGRYLIHCHNLEHEDHSMMARFDVV